MKYYDFAGIHIEILSQYLKKLDRFETFSSNSNRKLDFKLTLECCNEIMQPTGELILNEYIQNNIKMTLVLTHDNMYSFYLDNSVKIISRLDVDKDWNCAKITYIKSYPNYEYYTLYILGSLPLRNKIVFFDGLVIHASSIMLDNKGIMFSAPSGTGKSTHAGLWEKYLDAKVLNDDCPALRIIDKKVFVFGTPWSGSTDKFYNSSAELSAIIILEQSNINSIRRLEYDDIVQKLLPRCYLPYYDKNILNRALNNFENIVKLTPVYLLKCTPEKDAMELVYQSLKL